ncbi:hypothetical protein STAS_28298 [Striga asiatica]|uniref:Uncharacterized protein n=1 Tax=Striga asiatica TaxID=4170 RepID=A0A5A7QZX4_STRAF|nr:hypothetical protein STAS_28298 [Striga asiatica]
MVEFPQQTTRLAFARIPQVNPNPDEITRNWEFPLGIWNEENSLLPRQQTAALPLPEALTLHLGVANGDGGQGSRRVAVDPLRGEGRVPAEEAEPAGAEAAEGVAAARDGVEGDGREDRGEESAVPPALDLLDGLLGGDGADRGGGAVDDGDGGGCGAEGVRGRRRRRKTDCGEEEEQEGGGGGGGGDGGRRRHVDGAATAAMEFNGEREKGA